jgi:hypothetical protein
VDLATGQTAGLVGTGGLPLAAAAAAREVFDAWVPLIEPATVCVRERQRERERQRDRDRERDRERERESLRERGRESL